MQAEDVHASFLFVGYLNGHQQEWLGSTTTNCHCVASLDFTTMSSCYKLVVGPIHARGGTLDLMMTDVPDLVRVAVIAPLGNSDQHLSRWSFRWNKQLFQTCVLLGKFFWNTELIGIQCVVHYVICLGNTYRLLTILLRYWTRSCPCYGRCMATKVISVLNKAWMTIAFMRLT